MKMYTSEGEKKLTNLQITEEMYGGEYVRADLCPYCAGIPWPVETVDGETGEKSYRLLCEDRHAGIASGRFPTIREATLSWNRLADIYDELRYRVKNQNQSVKLTWKIDEDKQICEFMGWYDLADRFEGKSGAEGEKKMRRADLMRALLFEHRNFGLRYADNTIVSIQRQGGGPKPWCIRIITPYVMVTRYDELEVRADALCAQDVIIDLNKAVEMIVTEREEEE